MDFSKIMADPLTASPARVRTASGQLHRFCARSSRGVIGVLLLLGWGTALGAEGLPIRWTRKVELADLAEIPRRLEEQPQVKRPKQVKGSKLVLNGTPVSRCSEFLALEAAGHRPRPGAQFAVASAWDLQCGALALLRDARRPAVSYVRHVTLSRAIVDILPPTLGTAPSNEARQRAEAADRQGLAWAAFNPSLEVDVRDADEIAVKEHNGFTTTLTLLAFGDFNGDTIDDVLAFVSHRATPRGTYRAFEHVVLTRASPDARLSVVARPRTSAR